MNPFYYRGQQVISPDMLITLYNSEKKMIASTKFFKATFVDDYDYEIHFSQ